MTVKFFDNLKLPAGARLNKKLFKKLFYENAKLSARDKNFFKEEVQEVHLQYMLSPTSVNIPAFEDELRNYPEIACIEIKLKRVLACKSLIETIHKVIANPVVLLIAAEGQLQLSCCHKRINQADSSKITLEEIHKTDWFSPDENTNIDQDFLADSSLPNLSFVNLFKLYSDYITRLTRLNAALISGSYRNNSFPEAALKEYGQLEQDLKSLRSELKKETQFNRKLELNMQIKNLKQKLDTVRGLL